MRGKLTRKEFERKAALILARMREDATPFTDTSEATTKERKERGQRDLLYFFKTYLPHYFSLDYAEVHSEWEELADVEDEPVFLAAPREHAKSTFFTLGVPIHDICYELKHFLLVISDTEDLAEDFTVFIKLELEQNERIKQDFGDLTGNAWVWSAKDFVTKNSIRVKARGRGQRVRGLRNRQYRPDRVIIDDLENDKNSRNPRLVKETKKWLLTAVLGSLAEHFSFTMVGNVLARRGVLDLMIRAEAEDGQPKFLSRIYQAILDEGTPNERPLWPELWPMSRLKKRKRHQGEILFNQEMQNNPKGEGGLFQEEWLRYYHPTELAGVTQIIAAFLDPSVKKGEEHDYKAIITVALNWEEMIFYVRNAFIRRCSPDQMIRTAYNRHKEYQTSSFGYEDNAAFALLEKYFDDIALEVKFRLPLLGVTHTTSKEARVGSLSPLVERGQIRFLKGDSDQGLLIEQLIYFPSPTVKDDGPDALEGAIRLLQGFSSQKIEYQSVSKRRMQRTKGAY